MVERVLISEPFVKALGVSGPPPSCEHGEKTWHSSLLCVIRAEKEKETLFKEIPTKKKGNSRMRGIKLLHTIKQLNRNSMKLSKNNKNT